VWGVGFRVHGSGFRVQGGGVGFENRDRIEGGINPGAHGGIGEVPGIQLVLACAKNAGRVSARARSPDIFQLTRESGVPRGL